MPIPVIFTRMTNTILDQSSSVYSATSSNAGILYADAYLGAGLTRMLLAAAIVSGMTGFMLLYLGSRKNTARS
jgi:hypothetical protein